MLPGSFLIVIPDDFNAKFLIFSLLLVKHSFFAGYYFRCFSETGTMGMRGDTGKGSTSSDNGIIDND